MPVHELRSDEGRWMKSGAVAVTDDEAKKLSFKGKLLEFLRAKAPSNVLYLESTTFVK
jgi:hypothetical protein